MWPYVHDTLVIGIFLVIGFVTYIRNCKNFMLKYAALQPSNLCLTCAVEPRNYVRSYIFCILYAVLYVHRYVMTHGMTPLL